MKKLVLFLAVAALFAACDKDKDKGNGLLDPNAMISLRAAKAQKSVAEAGTRAETHLSALEIVKQAHSILFVNKVAVPGSDEISRGFADAQRDFVNERLLMWGIDIIYGSTSNYAGQLRDDFIGGEDIVLVRFVPADEIYPREHRDTIAYIPNPTLRTAYTAIHAAYDQKDYATVYKLFDEAFTFVPITGAEWQALKKQGLN